MDDANEIRVLYTARGGVRNPDVVDEAFLLDKYGIPTGAAYADMAVLRGDSSDGLPGVAGIGEKTAAKLITTYGSLEALRAAIDGGDPAIKGAQRARLEAGAEYLDAAPRVVEVVRDAPLGEVDLGAPHPGRRPGLMSRLAVDHGLTNVFDRAIGALGPIAPAGHPRRDVRRLSRLSGTRIFSGLSPVGQPRRRRAGPRRSPSWRPAGGHGRRHRSAGPAGR